MHFKDRNERSSRKAFLNSTTAVGISYNVTSEIFTGIQNRRIAGYRGIHLFRRNLGDEVEFVTVMWFDSIEAVRAFAGKDYEVAVVPQKARALLSRFDARSQHYEVKAEIRV
jgi:heme-degrading monooxygenase HmoA